MQHKHKGWECLPSLSIDGVNQNISYSEEYGYTAVYPHGDFAAKAAAEEEVERAFAPKPQPKQSAQQTFPDLIQCRKWAFKNGEKRLFSGWMNQWVKLDSDDSGAIQFVFLYRQPVTYLVKELKDPFTKSRRVQVLECIKEGLWQTPFSAYGQRITAWSIITFSKSPEWKGRMKLNMESGDDDIFELMFPESEIDKVKDFIKSNFKTLSYESIEDWARENNYEL